MKRMQKTTRSNFITYGIVIVGAVLLQSLDSAGKLSSLFSGLLSHIPWFLFLALVFLLGERRSSPKS